MAKNELYQLSTRRKYLKYLFLFCLSPILSCTNRKESAKGLENPMDCSDLSSLAEEELKKRQDLGYSETSPVPDRNCENCNLFIPKSEKNNCAGCLLFKGAVAEEGYCTYWAPQV